MLIVPPEHFRHAGELEDGNAARDPRSLAFSEETVEIDLRHCKFVRPPALLWCLTYPLVAQKRSNVTIHLPEQPGVLHWLFSLGLPEILESAHVTVTCARRLEVTPDARVVLPLTRFETASDAEAVIEAAHDSLERSGLGAANVRPLVGQLFSELALNAVQHSDSGVAAYGYVQYYEYAEGPRFVCGVADGGVGIRQALAKNPQFRGLGSDASAIDKALEEHVSGTREPNRGIGLHWVRDKIASPGRRFVLHSVSGAILIEGAQAARARFARLFPGTAACFWIPT